jgi:hypothetical protein
LQKTAKALGLLIITVLFLSISSQFIQFSNVSAVSENVSPSIAVDYGDYGVVAHQITSSELQAYQGSLNPCQENQPLTYAAGEYGTGLTAPTNDEWSDIAENGYIVEQVTNQTAPPAAVDLSLSQYFPPIGDQASQGSCASFAIGYYCKTYQEAKENDWNLSEARWTGGDDDGNVSVAYQGKVMSPAFVYNLINPGNDVGSDFETPIRLVSNVGVCSWAKMPYYWQDYTRWPTEDAWTEAPVYRANSTYSYQYLYTNTSLGVESLKNWLAAGNLAIVGIDAIVNLWNYTGHSNALNSQDLLTTDTYKFSGLNHAATIVGYDDLFTYVENGTVRHGAFKIANTWGKGSWENIPDGCYWISYAALQNRVTADNPVVLFQDQTGYQPELLATFNIAHMNRDSCNVTFGLGTPEAPLVTKNFTDFVFGGNHSFCANNIVFDITEFKNYLTSQFNQPFFMQVYDAAVDAYNHTTAETGTVTYFAVANTSCTQTPLATVNGQFVNLTLVHSFAQAEFSLSPLSGPASGQVTLNGVGIQSSAVNISYYNPISLQWIPVVNDYAVSTNFSLTLPGPDLQQSNPPGDNTPRNDTLIFRVQDGNSTYTASYIEYCRGLTQVGTQTASGVFGSNTDLSSLVRVKSGESLAVAGKWFAPGTVTLLWDNIALGTANVNQAGFFSTTVTVPASSVGQHTLTANNGNSNVAVTLTYQATPISSTAEPKSTTAPTPTPTASPVPNIPEYNTPLFLLILAVLTASAMVMLKTRKAIQAKPA